MRLLVVLLFSLIACVSAWDDGDLEVFDVVEEVNQNFYELLGVKQEAEPAEIKSAFKKLTLKLHPDKNDAPDADVQFRNLVSVHNILKDPSKREKYNEVLKNGLPNWRSAVYYYRHLRKMGLAEASIILFIIITLGQYAVSWAAYIEKRYTAEQILNNRKKTKKSGFDTGLAEILQQLPKPSMKDTLPFQIPKFIWWSIMAVPRGVIELKERQKQKKEEEKRQKKREEEDRIRAEREATAAAERAAAGAAARKRRQFVPPERDHCLLDAAPAPDEGPVVVPVKPKSAPPPISGGLWTDDDLAELVRLVKKHPGGSAERWERIAEAMNRSVPEVVHVAATLKENCYRIPGQEPEPVVVEPPKKVKTRKTEDTANTANVANWSQTQQKALEAALAKHPKGGAGDRWAKIASSVPGKTKEDCMARCRYLSEMVRKQKQKEEEESQKTENGDVQTEHEHED